MNCQFKIATRTGGHFPCALEPNHDGDCVPVIDGVPRPRPPRLTALPEPAFLEHLLRILNSTMLGRFTTLGQAEAIKLCRELLRERLGFGEEVPF